jgi:putative hemolysin
MNIYPTKKTAAARPPPLEARRKTEADMSELEKLCAKRDEMQAELDLLKPQQASVPTVIPRVLSLSAMLCDCDQMIANARVNEYLKSVTPNESSSAIGTGQGATNATKPK